MNRLFATAPVSRVSWLEAVGIAPAVYLIVEAEK
jgi:hypothetical protein